MIRPCITYKKHVQMDFKEIELLIIRYFSQTANMSDLDILNKWIENKENQAVFDQYVKTHYLATLSLNNPEHSSLQRILLKEIKKEKRKKRLEGLYKASKYTAAAILLLLAGFIAHQNFSGRKDFKPQSITQKNDQVTLKLADGSVKIIPADGNSKIYDANGKVIGQQKGKSLVYSGDKKCTKLIYNTLNIPNGKRFTITLCDGTLVHLNAGSSITFPVEFLKDKARRVLLSGEAYFEVAHDRKNAFLVNSGTLNVQVYGTKFNINSYPEDKNTDVVLIEGSVSLSKSGSEPEGKNEFFLIPGFKATFNKNHSSISKEKVNTSLYTSWINGNLVFREESFENIIKKLERHYNVTIINHNKSLAHETFNATVETNTESIEQVLNYFKKVYQIDYSVKENKIIIH